jgi:hypothetical protein
MFLWLNLMYNYLQGLISLSLWMSSSQMHTPISPIWWLESRMVQSPPKRMLFWLILTMIVQSPPLVNISIQFPIFSGGADAAVPIGVMIELLNVLVHSVPLKHAVIFLFNGAEETLQEGSHAFITLHPWANSCRVVVNLEACGSGGPELLFQAGSSFALQGMKFNKRNKNF